jgi:hypothetical protein
MNAELEALIKLLDALLNAVPGEETERLDAPYHTRIEEVRRRYPGLSRENLQHSIDRAYARWVKAQKDSRHSHPRRNAPCSLSHFSTCPLSRGQSCPRS